MNDWHLSAKQKNTEKTFTLRGELINASPYAAQFTHGCEVQQIILKKQHIEFFSSVFLSL